MPRGPRMKSETKTYHIMLRGINQQVIFEDKEDYERFVFTLEKYKDICGYKLYAFCIMPNHIHLLIKTENEELDMIMKRIAGSYVYWYNTKYYRKGHLFQDRFKSEPVEDDVYFLTVLRYIHQNPVKAGIATKPEEYSYSSYHHYTEEKNNLIEIEFALEMLGMNQFIIFNNESNRAECLDIEENKLRLNDIDAVKIAEEVTGLKSKDGYVALTATEKERYIKLLKQKGLSIRQISRVTGIGKSIVEKAKL